MIMYRVVEEHIVGTVHNTVFRRHLCEWVLPQEVARKHVYVNPRHLPVVVEDKHVDILLLKSILRVLHGYIGSK